MPVAGGRRWPCRTVEYARAGHLPLLHASRTGVTSRRATGVPLGMFCTTDFPVCSLKLDPGDSLFLYTDGLSEVFNLKGDEYGLCRVEELLARHASKPPDQMLSSCLNDERRFAA